MKYILLDFDGVLTSDDYTRMSVLGHRQANLFGVDFFDPTCIEALRYIIEKTGASVIISSSWRDLGMDRLGKVWIHNSLPGELAGTTPEWILMKKDALLDWVDGHPEDRYVVIDDADLDIPFQVRTDPVTGLTSTEAEMAIKILNS